MPLALSDADRQLVIRCIMDAQHILAVRNGGTFVEAGVDLQDADETTSSIMQDGDLIARLGLALAVLGRQPGETPDTVSDQLRAALRLPDPPP